MAARMCGQLFYHFSNTPPHTHTLPHPHAPTKKKAIFFYGTDYRLTNHQGYTVLHWIAVKNQAAILADLVRLRKEGSSTDGKQYALEVDATSHLGETPLHLVRGRMGDTRRNEKK